MINWLLILACTHNDFTLAIGRNTALKSLAGNFPTALGSNNHQNQPAFGQNQLWKLPDPRFPLRRVSMKPLKPLQGSHWGDSSKIKLSGEPTEYEIKEINDLLKSANIESWDYALGKAASWGKESLFDYLMTEKSDLLSENGKNIALQLAAAHGNLKYVARLLQENDINPGADDNLALYFSIFFNQRDIFDLLIRSDRKKVQITSAIYLEAKKPGREWFLQRILSDKRLSLPDIQGKAISDPLLVAIRQENEEMVKTFLNFGKRTQNEYSNALNVAAGTGNLNIVRLLLPKVDFELNQNEAIRIAAIQGHADIVEMIMPLSSYLDDALFSAAVNGQEKVVEILLKDKRVKIPQLTLTFSPPDIQKILKREPLERFEPKNYVYTVEDDSLE